MSLFKEGCYWLLLRILRAIGFGRRHPSDGVLLFKTDRIGDFVLSTGALQMLCRKFGPEKVTMMVSKIVQPLAEREFPLCRIIAVPPSGDHLRGGLLSGWWAVRRANGGRSYRQIVSLRHHPTLFEDLLLGSIQAKESIALVRTALGDAHRLSDLRTFRARCTVPYPIPKEPHSGCLELEAHRRVTEATLGHPVSFEDIIPRLTRFEGAIENHLLLAPFSSQPIKDYPTSRLVEALIAAALPDSIPFVICGEDRQTDALMALASEIRSRLQNPVQLAQPVGLVEFVECVARARSVCSMDSAAAHIATALDHSGVFILGGGHMGHFAPWKRSIRQEWLHLRLDCFGCDWQCNQPYVRCIHDIPATTLGAAIRRVWTSSGE